MGVWMYERATKTRLITGGVDYLDLLKSMDEFRGISQSGIGSSLSKKMMQLPWQW
ncbi:hypothetical protein HSBAA_PA_3860 (plasmid) [Vreelandella sulfidaeris]|uniref:Uncharacterized protein n=1 Tax=Vreelandella sulfidaeris TaxID=115553 RepID=A0A455UKB3_9GAMM|nr:hypothetical protein HSBAA_PA_3860 [Halomonas sulfidaeris]